MDTTDTIQNCDRAGGERNRAGERDNYRISRTEKETRGCYNDYVNRNVGRMNNIGCPDQPGYEDDVYYELNARLQQKCFGKNASERVQHGEAGDDGEGRQRCPPEL